MQDSQVLHQSPRRAPAAPLPDDPAPCYPDRPDLACYSCVRRRFGDAPRADHRVPLRIDASGFRVDGKCQMHVPTRVVAVVRQPTALEMAWRASA